MHTIPFPVTWNWQAALKGPHVSWLSQENRLSGQTFPGCLESFLNTLRSLWISAGAREDSWRWLRLCQVHFVPCEPAPYLGSSRLGRCALMAPRLVGLDPKGIFYINIGRELFHFSLTVMDRQRFVGVQGLVRFVYLVAINSTAPIVLDLTNGC